VKVVSVPRWVWKLVYEPMQKGIVFLVAKNPYRSSFACRCVCPNMVQLGVEEGRCM